MKLEDFINFEKETKDRYSRYKHIYTLTNIDDVVHLRCNYCRYNIRLYVPINNIDMYNEMYRLVDHFNTEHAPAIICRMEKFMKTFK